ncbi:DNA-3-methyladenine glycosylase I [Marinococcus luteus]|uniref:DNA-3-methyladenine glycosylase I n=1 Tax=Marinococcus luteus TaxID=1122204 RepID=UPI002ACC5B33|nr:DNA-3-methyladenine glycosylase I [Marinococcus luteus]MDZ5783064.1 DNA-3-methyladenine glycosylase I [Marinococcus luteus]
MERCSWSRKNERMQEYHDNEWGRPYTDDSYLFELLTLEGAQSGLSWNTVLAKRHHYQEAFQQFDIQKCASMTDEDLEYIRNHYGVIKHPAKLASVRNNAVKVLTIQDEYGSLSSFFWRYVDFTPIIHEWKEEAEVPSYTELSTQISRELKKRQFKFVGPVTVYSFMQAIGMVDDHVRTCPCHSKNTNA